MVENESAYLERDIVPLADVSCQVDNSLHPLHLPLDDLVEILLFNLWETQEMDRSRIARCRIFGDEWS